uniref:Trigger factor n=1 Tax=Desulfomonile tiedjei TaxID=2358 RepID=A0A7C4ARD6_9BACT
MATIVVEDVSPIKKRVTFEVPEETVRNAIESQYMDLKKTVQIKGFRKGKAPLQIIKGYFRGKVEGDALKKVIEDTLEPGLVEKEIKPLTVLSIDPETLETGKPFRFSAVVEVAPEITPVNYKGMKLKRPAVNVSDKMLEDYLQQLRNLNARLVSIPEDRGARMGDHLIVDIKAEVDGEPIASLTVDDYHLEMGRDFYLPGFDVYLEGAKIDEEKEFTIDFPADFPNKSLAGKKGVFHASCKEIKERVLPDLDDEFAKDFGDYSSLEELKNRVRGELEQDLKSEAEGKIRTQIKQQLLENYDFEVPLSLVQERLEEMIRGFLGYYAEQGIDPKRLAESGAIPRDQMRVEAEKEAKISLIIQAIADREAIQASEEELDAEYERMADRLEIEPDKRTALLEARPGVEAVRRIVIENKTYRFLEENAVFMDEEEASDKKGPQPETESA